MCSSDLDGSLDTSFNRKGFSIRRGLSDGDEGSYGVVIQSDGKIVSAGYRKTPSGFLLTRYNSDGSLDPLFGVDGSGMTFSALAAEGAEDGEGAQIHGIALDANGKLVVVGPVAPFSYAVGRYLP